MRKTEHEIIISAGDLSNHSACRHLTSLDLAAAHGFIEQPTYRDPSLAILQERGLEFELEYLSHLNEQGYSIFEPGVEDTNAIERTISAMKSGVDVIYQASLKSGVWLGRADFLKKVDKPSNLGSWSYEVIDSKLANETRAGTILQICLYSELISEIQGIMPDQMHVMTPEDGFSMHTFRLDDYLAYYRLIKNRLLSAIEPTDLELYPVPVAQCDICRWWQKCVQRRRDDDHLSFVAGLSGSQTSEINKWGVDTLEKLAGVPLPLAQVPARGAIETYVRVREQARVQLQARETQVPVYELLPHNNLTGVSRLPEPSVGDIFFDFEGDPFVGRTGLEYLFGWVFADDDRYHKIWALNASEEKEAFETFVDLVMERWEAYPNLHIYHYTAYEPSALKRLMGKYATREAEIDKMLRGNIFIDIYSIVEQAIRAGIERYSLKELEVFYEFQRKMELRDASHHLRTFERLIETNHRDRIPEDTIRAIESYNSEDCLSTRHLRNWLETIRKNLLSEGYEISRPQIDTGEASEALTEHQQRVQELYDRLAHDVSINFEERNEEEHARWLLANMLDWYRREKKAIWWEYFRILSLPPEELIEEKAALSGLNFTGYREQVGASVIDSYQYPSQDCDIRKGDSLKNSEGLNAGTVEAINLDTCVINIRKGAAITNHHPISVFKHIIVNDTVKEQAIFRFASWVADNGIDSDGFFRSGRDLLLKNAPRTSHNSEMSDDAQASAVDIVLALNQGVLPIQGPPGAGKSHTAANMIIALVAAGKKVGVTALSHKVISGLLDKVIRTANEQNVELTCIQKVKAKSQHPNPRLLEVTTNEKVLEALVTGQANIAAGTSWLWAREDFDSAVDVLFVDEAGQLSLIDTLAVSLSAKNIVLLGDPQQLQQPQQGSHPEGTEVSALEHILNGQKTIPSDRGIFLDTTWRLHPEICAFTSELFYESRLGSKSHLIQQLLDGNTKYTGAGLWYEPVVHEGNQSLSLEEVHRVNEIVSELIKGDVFWTDGGNVRRVLTLSDIMVIAPYNAQVVGLESALPAATHIGTVDKFQGQEAPVVIFSMSTSTPEDAPRGMEFLYSLNRLNVAVSRARSACILVASPRLFEPECKSPSQMRLANAFCRYIEMAR
jgi:predicted RecB family nuclease